jgi:hypothetical protein
MLQVKWQETGSKINKSLIIKEKEYLDPTLLYTVFFLHITGLSYLQSPTIFPIVFMYILENRSERAGHRNR